MVSFAGATIPGASQRSESEARTLAAQIARSLAARPDEFAAARAQFCAEASCFGVAPIVSDGSSYPTVYRKLAGLPVGAVSTHSELGPSGFIVFQRVAVPRGASADASRIFKLPPILDDDGAPP